MVFAIVQNQLGRASVLLKRACLDKLQRVSDRVLILEGTEHLGKFSLKFFKLLFAIRVNLSYI